MEAKISIITNDGERFEGVLHLVDEESNTVTLKDVIKLGNEELEEKKKAIRPRVADYDIMKFDGKNLKEVKVVSKDKPRQIKKASSNVNQVASTDPKVTTFANKPEHVKVEHPLSQNKHVNLRSKNSSRSNGRKDQYSNERDSLYRRTGKPRPGRTSAISLEGEFDFVEHNKKYEKMSEELQSMKVYDKNISFFDKLPEKNISNERLRVHNTKNHGQSARNLDFETFGVKSLSSNLSHSRCQRKPYRQ